MMKDNNEDTSSKAMLAIDGVRFGINKWYQSFALRNFDLEDMELESTNSGPTAKLPILKLGEYEMWVIRIKQYFQIQDYALWEVIENGDSWVSVPQTTQENGTSVTKMSIPVTAEEKTNKKNDVKARGLLLMALPKEHQLTFSQYPDAKSMFAAIETRFGESLDSIFNRLQKIVSRLAILVVWMNKPKVETMSIDDLYNNFKIVEQKVKKSVGGSSGSQNLAFMTAPSTNSTNDTNTASLQVSTASPNVNAASPQVSTASISDNTVYAFMVKNPNGYNVLHQDLEQIHEDDLEAMYLKWQLSLLSVRAKKYYQRTCKKIFINANDIVGYDKSKVECYNCHKLGHFARKCSATRRKEGQFRNQDNTKKQGNNENTSLKAMLAIDGVGFDWSDMAEEQVQTNMALMAFSDSEVYIDKTCSKTCLKNYETLKKQCDDLLVKLNESEFKVITYKRGLATLEDQIITYKKNEVLFSKEIGVLNREVACKDYEINMLKSEFEKVKQEKHGIEFKIEKFDKASKDLDQLLGSQITDKCKKGLRYSAVPPPYPLIYNRPNKLDLSYSGLDEFKEPEFKGYGLKHKEQVSQDTSNFVKSSPNVDKETVFPVNKKVEFTKPKNHEKPVKKSVRPRVVTTARVYSGQVNVVRVNGVNAGKPQHDDKRFVDNGCSRHMTGNIAYLSDFKEFDGGYVALGGTEKTKDAQAKEIVALKKRVQKLERNETSRTTGLKRLKKVSMSRRVKSSKDQESLGAPEDASKQGRSIADIDADVEVTLVDETQERHDDELMFDTGVLDADEIPVEAKVDEKDEQRTKLNDSTAGEAVTTASVEYSAAPTTSEDNEGELMKHLVIKKGEDIAIDAIRLANKLLVIIDYKLHKEGMLVHYQLIRADGSSKRYSSMIRMLQGIDREDLEALWKIVKTKYSDIRPEDEFERVLWGDLKVMFELDKRSDVWRILQGYTVTI
ncbi:ribonuclease H-like domain-containing protein [Tanacetum coccineum]